MQTSPTADALRVPIRRPVAALLLLAIGLVTIEVALWWIATRTPSDIVLGLSQKIFYFHVGSAFAMLLGLSAASIMSLVDLLRPDDRADALARSFLEVGVVFSLCLLTSGPLWARKAWGMYWTWEPRLTLSLLVTLLAISVIALRSMSGDSHTGRRVGAAMAVMAAPASYLIHVAVKWWGGNHPQVIQGGGIQSADMRIAFWLAVVGLLTFASVLVVTRYRDIRLQQRAQALRLTLSAHQLRQRRA
ncbi:MAG: cytochrome c biogenesis protein CcsA [Myxococcales bacterium]|nr:cytochrome c biogenesis protein CcsA [Myxococcales bacterium]